MINGAQSTEKYMLSMFPVFVATCTLLFIRFIYCNYYKHFAIYITPKKKPKRDNWKKKNWFIFLFCLFVCLSFEGCTHSIWRFPGQGSNQSFSCYLVPQPQKCRIWAMSASYTRADVAQGNVGSLTHWVIPGIEPVFSWMLVRHFSTELQWVLLIYFDFK